jgi:hypothetical protein
MFANNGAAYINFLRRLNRVSNEAQNIQLELIFFVGHALVEIRFLSPSHHVLGSVFPLTAINTENERAG